MTKTMIQNPFMHLSIKQDTYNELLRLREQYGSFDKAIKALIGSDVLGKDKKQELFIKNE
jgi:hypothetical protein